MADGGATVAKRDRWSSRTTFILGAIGSAVGLGNLWRFPFLVFDYGGGTFLIPYFICLLFFGVPLLLMEITLGRQFQGGDPVCFAAMHPRLVGIGWMSAFGSFLLATYYPVLIAWIVVFFFNSFRDPLPWALQEGNRTDALAGAIDFFVNDVLADSGDIAVQETFNPMILLSLAFVWVCVYLSIYKGVGVVSQVVKVSVPLPIVTLVVLLVNSVGRDGADKGIEAYIGNWDLTVLGDPQIWQAAVGQVFFSIGVCFGVMTAYSSYMESKKGLLTDSLLIALLDSAISFFAGFVVFTAVGVLAEDLGVNVADEDFSALISGGRLVFIAYPAALEGLDFFPQVFSAVFFLTLFFLALDSAFSIVEAIVAALYDTNAGRQYDRKVVTLAVVIALFLFGIFFALDNGSYWLDLIDYYLNNFLMLGIGALECMATMWVFGFSDSSDELGNKAMMIFSGFYLLATFLAPICIMFFPYYGIPAGFLMWILVATIGYVFAFVSCNPVQNKGYKLFFSGGASKLMRIMAVDEFDDINRVTAGFSIVLHLWCILCKYVIPVFLTMLMLTGAKANFENLAFGFDPVFHNVGNFVTVVGWGIFFLFLFIKVDSYSDRVAEYEDMRAEQEMLEVEDDKKKEEELGVPVPPEVQAEENEGTKLEELNLNKENL